MIPLTLSRVAAAVDGRLAGGADPAATVTGAPVTDHREVGAGGVFAALPGAHHDGHDFASDAVAAGAVAVLCSREVAAPCVVVPDVAVALGQLARAVLDAAPAVTVVGVTGSSGKTTVKDLVAALLRRLGPTVAPVASFNNEIGLPLTVCRVTEDTRFLVLEYSARGAGHIAYLCGIAPPQVGVELNVGSAHVGMFGSRAAIATAKAELVEALPTDGVAVLNGIDPLVAGMAARTRARVVRFGGVGAEVRAENVRLDELGRPGFTLRAYDTSAEVALQLYGPHQVPNALAAAAVAVELGLSTQAVAEELGAATPASRWRMEVHRRPDGVTVVNDAYNANPESTRAALDALAAMRRRRGWAVLGEMLELGAAGPELHAEVGRYAGEVGVDEVVAVGPGPGVAALAAAAAAAGVVVHAVPDAAAATALLRGALQPRDVVLVKASRAAGLEQVALELLAGVPDGVAS